MIVAKFTCTSVNPTEYGEEVTFDAVHPQTMAEDDPNREWSEATPTGEIKMVISNPAARGRFQQGKNYLVRFDPSED